MPRRLFILEHRSKIADLGLRGYSNRNTVERQRRRHAYCRMVQELEFGILETLVYRMEYCSAGKYRMVCTVQLETWFGIRRCCVGSGQDLGSSGLGSFFALGRSFAGHRCVGVPVDRRDR